MLAKHHVKCIDSLKEFNKYRMIQLRNRVSRFTRLYANGLLGDIITYDASVPLAQNTDVILLLRALKYKDIHCKLRKVKDHDGRPRLKITFTGLIK